MSLDQFLGIVVTNENPMPQTTTESDSIRSQIMKNHLSPDMNLENKDLYDNGKPLPQNPIYDLSNGEEVKTHEWFTATPTYFLHSDVFLNYLTEKFEDQHLSLDEQDSIIDDDIIDDVLTKIDDIKTSDEPELDGENLLPISDQIYDKNYLESINFLGHALLDLKIIRTHLNDELPDGFKAYIIYLPWW